MLLFVTSSEGIESTPEGLSMARIATFSTLNADDFSLLALCDYRGFSGWRSG